MIRRIVLTTALLSAAGFHGIGAQRPETVVRVRVVDTTGAPVAGADVAAMRGMTAVVVSGATDASGIRRLVVPRGDDELQIVVRRIGFQRGDHFFRADRDSLSLVIRLRQTPHALPAVQVTASEDLKQKRFHVTADDIAESKRPISNGLDVITKLRPDMMDPPGQGIFTRCGMYYIWINGRRIVFPPIDPGLAIKTSQQRRAARATANSGAGRLPVYTGTALVPVSVQSVLATIHPEHIDEINYVDCRDSQSTDMVRGQNAVFVVLKRGVGYEAGRGSYVMSAAALDAADAAEVVAVDSAAAPSLAQAFRHRLLGVYDQTSGEPLKDVEVVDVATGTFAKTTTTGTVSLAFLPEGASTIQLRRAGYTDLKLEISISPRDTAPLTLLISPKPK